MLLKAGEGLEGNDSVLFQRYWFADLQSQVQLTRIADDFMFCANCCDENTSFHGHETKLPFFKSIYSSMEQPAVSTPECSAFCNDNDAEGSMSIVGYLQVHRPNRCHFRLYCFCRVSYLCCVNELFSQILSLTS